MKSIDYYEIGMSEVKGPTQTQKPTEQLEGKKLVEVLRNYFAGQPDVMADYPFGSQATAKARPKSDVDTAVLLSGEDSFACFKRRLRLLAVIPSLQGGGAERALVTLLDHFDDERFQIRLAVFDAGGPFRRQLSVVVPVHDLKGRQQYDVRMITRLAQLLRRHKPDVVLSVMRYANLATLLAARLARSPGAIVVNEQNNPSAEFRQFGGRWFKGLALKYLYPQADRVTAISSGIATELTTRWGIPESEVTVIPNPVDVARIRRLAQERPPHPWLTDREVPVVMGAGRLHPQKDFGLLLRAFRRVRDAQAARLIILGEGSERAFLEHEVKRLGLSEDVLLPGFQDNPFAWMARSSVFVLSSQYEGFGNVIVEAMALGRPVVATNCHFGPDEIIEDGVSGLLVPVGHEEVLAGTVNRLLNDHDLVRSLSEAGRERSHDFAPARIVAQYEGLFAEVLERRAHSHRYGHLPA